MARLTPDEKAFTAACARLAQSYGIEPDDSMRVFGAVSAMLAEHAKLTNGAPVEATKYRHSGLFAEGQATDLAQLPTMKSLKNRHYPN